METKLLNSQEMVEKSGLNWKVTQGPVLYQQATGELVKVTDKRANYREDTQTLLGIVGDGYKVVQNGPCFAFLDSFLGEQIEMYVKAGCWNNGAQVYIRAKLPGTLIFAGNAEDTGHKYVDFYTSHDGSIALTATITAYRLICSNGLKGYRKIAGAKAKHTMNLSLDTMRESLGLLNAQFAIMEQLSERMASQEFQRERFGKVLEQIGMIPKEDKRSTRAQNILEYVESLWRDGKGAHLQGAAGTAWGAYNAITEYVDHYRGKDEEKRAESSAIGSGAMLKERALEVLSA